MVVLLSANQPESHIRIQMEFETWPVGSPAIRVLDLVKRNQDFVQISRSLRLIQMIASLDEVSTGS